MVILLRSDIMKLNIIWCWLFRIFEIVFRFCFFFSKIIFSPVKIKILFYFFVKTILFADQDFFLINKFSKHYNLVEFLKKGNKKEEAT